MERWVAEKFGLFNFWYYDDVEFKLSNGKIIFRGTNGSGKSVTTQSFIPLLLDGDKRPSRIDPFGSNARKIEKYVLIDEDIQDRISYLYMEFKKPLTESYISIGMGLRGRKGKKLESWYFILKDGRRINKDFKLYKKSGEKFPLTSKQLENALGEGNIFTTSQREYMEKVNEHLFGYSDIDNYKDLLNLLIQLRSPKLSRDFKPTVIYEILKESLNTLSQDDLRTMADAMDNMDSLNNKLNELNKSIEALERIEKAFKNYNLSILHNKCKKYSLKKQEISSFKKQVDSKNRELRNILEENLAKERELEKLEKELETARVKEKALKGSKGFEIRDEITKEEEILREIENELKSKNKSFKQKYDLRIKREEDIKIVENNKYKDEKLFYDTLDDEEYYREQCFFYINDNLRDVLKLKDNYDFNIVLSSIYEYENLVSNAFDILKEAENISKRLNLEEEKMHKIESRVKTKENALHESNEYLTNIKGEYIEKINIYIENLKFLKIKDNDKIQINKFINEINEDADLNKVFDKVREIANEIEIKIAKDKLIFTEKQKNINEKLEKVQEKINELENKKQVFIEEEDKILAKTILDKEKLPYEEFYKLVDFNESLTEEEKNSLEAKLFNMGILTSIVVPLEFKKKAEELLKDLNVKIISSGLEEEENNITKYLKLDDSKFNKDYKNDTIGILKSISIKELGKNKTLVNLDSSYTIGIIKGGNNKNYKSQYIGVESRENFRKRQIHILSLEKEDILKEKKEIELALLNLEEKEIVLSKEKDNFPEGRDIISALKLIKENIENLDRENKELLFVKETILEINKENTKVKGELFKACEHIKIPKTIKCYETALKDIREYIKTINKLKNIYADINYSKRHLEELKEYLQEILEDIDTINGEISVIKEKIKKKENSIKGLNEALKAFNLGELEAEYKRITKIINTYPDDIRKISNDVSETKATIKHLKENIHKFNEELNYENGLLILLKDVVLQEINLNYIEEIENLDFNTAVKWVLDNIEIKNENVFAEVFNVFSSNESYILDYHPRTETIFNNYEEDKDVKRNEILKSASRLDIRCRFNKKEISIYELKNHLKINLETESILISDRERDIFENILIDTLSNKINAKIYKAKGWVKEIDSLMKSMNTSSGFKLYLRWKPKKAGSEGEMDISELTEILSAPDFMTHEDRQKVSNHFKEKLKREKRILTEDGSKRSYQSIIKEVLDYRQWFEFQLSFSKPSEKKKELTDNEFFVLSGGEKAMAMYIPLFAAVNARYNAADKKDCPRIISLDEAFAGVDESNISSMFTLIESLNLDYVLNSQVLWGTYESVKSLSIYELIREDGEDTVLPIKYHWDGHIRTMGEVEV
ncbi:Chromosome segregation ATPase [Clostridium sp. DSM 8431]|uniref:SbcC/MukB-like Walker B domain-containing protein n=1 Tax=Clostridium sp. DSM 8431 TaxID=1761781 RepID=UPI0008E8DD34|nr:SbcC/MukB-like Walker B domain-containing protein [Clostridium sp. DSM 8431]SFU53655.1 Chromosome segregation ATPase [Clostridium sp. DSM 8431]